MPGHDEKPALDFDEVAEILSDLECLNFFPTTDSGRIAVQKIVGSMASNIDQVRWLVGRMLQLYNNWPGPAELRAVFCKRFKPADGVDVRNTHTSAYFPDGNIPCETPEAPPFSPGRLLPGGRKDLLLPAGHDVSVDVEIENGVRRASAAVSMTAAGKRDTTRAALVPVKNVRRITAADVERAASEVHSARLAPHDFEDSGVDGLCRVCWLSHSGGGSVPEQKTA